MTSGPADRFQELYVCRDPSGGENIGLVEYEPLNGWYKSLTNVKTNMDDGTALSLHSVTGVPLWVWALVFAGGAFTSVLSGQAKLLSKPPEQTLDAILGGFLVGVGAALATGCVLGNIMSGWALLSLGIILFGIVTILANWAKTYMYLIGIDARQRT